eukprot:TRINITY_DN15556_c0_g1_i1.p1 TRINITY_DN15556_c0_g1~~TRINITY_DN15556_c0_g1_i1.p1  ORF type:complete len:703 (-),score=86.88 TRINITY_DN15556_c0_g1_i1:108-2216(-)
MSSWDYYWTAIVSPNLEGRSVEALATISDVVNNDDLLGYIISFFDIDFVLRLNSVCKRFHWKQTLRHVRILRPQNCQRVEDEQRYANFFLVNVEHLSGVRQIHWYFLEPENPTFQALVSRLAPQIEVCEISNTWECGFLDQMNPKILVGLQINKVDPSDPRVANLRLENLQYLRIDSDDDVYAEGFDVSIDSLLHLYIYPAYSLQDTDADKLAAAIQRRAAANPNLRKVDVQVYHRGLFTLANRLLLGATSEETILPEKLDQVEELCRARLGISVEALAINGLSLWSIFYILSPVEQLVQAKNTNMWRRGFATCYRTTHERFFNLCHFIIRLYEPSLQDSPAALDPYYEEIEHVLDEMIAAESRFVPLLNTTDIACAILNWGGLMLLRYGNDANVRQRVSEQCRSTLQNTPNLLTVCASPYCYDYPVTWTICPALHCVLELGEWYDPTTRIIKDRCIGSATYCSNVFLALAVHPSFNPDILVDESDHLCRFMLQCLLQWFVDPDVSTFDASYLALAKMCVERHLKINISNKISSYCLQRMFANEEMLELFSHLADDLANLSDCEIFGSGHFGMSTKLFNGLCFMLKQTEARTGEFWAPVMTQCRSKLSHAIWKGFKANNFSFLIYEPEPILFEYVFEIWPSVPEPYVEFLEQDSIASNYSRPAIIKIMYDNEKLRKYLPPAALRWALDHQNYNVTIEVQLDE